MVYCWWTVGIVFVRSSQWSTHIIFLFLWLSVKRLFCTLIDWCNMGETALFLFKVSFDTSLLTYFSIFFKVTTAFITGTVGLTNILCLRCAFLSLLTAASFSLIHISKFKYGVFIYSQFFGIWKVLNSSFCRSVCLKLPHIFLHTSANSVSIGSPFPPALKLITLCISPAQRHCRLLYNDVFFDILSRGIWLVGLPYSLYHPLTYQIRCHLQHVERHSYLIIFNSLLLIYCG